MPAVNNITNRQQQNSANFGSAYLLMFDFDGTQAQTFEPSPSGVGVEENYELTINEIFGPEVLDTYLREGGLKNRNPAEVIRGLYGTHPELADLALLHLNKNRSALSDFMRSSAHLLDDWDNQPLKAATEVYIRQDLMNSLGHIGLKHEDGSVWPRPCEGFDSLWSTIGQINDQNQNVRIDTAVISSGYTEYIEKTFDVWGLPCPDIWVTDNETRSLVHPIEDTRRVKPAPFGVALAHHKWLRMHDKSGPNFDVGTAIDAKRRMFLFGDGLAKDGGMAKRSNIGFGHFDSSKTTILHAEHTTFGDWRDIEERLVAGVANMIGGAAISKIIRAEI